VIEVQSLPSQWRWTRAFMYRSDWERCCFARYLIRLRPDLNRIVPRFLSYVTQTRIYWDEIAVSTIQATIQNVSAERYGKFRLAGISRGCRPRI
jgi:type I restriction enzyme, S subunit